MKRLIKKILRKHVPVPDIELELITKAIAQELASLPESRIGVKHGSSVLSTQFPVNDDQAKFDNFFNRYCASKKVLESCKDISKPTAEELQAGSELQLLRLNHPVLCDCADIVFDYLGKLNSLSPLLSSVMKRFSFRHLSILNPATKSDILDCKKRLPKVGMLFFPNAEVRDFLSEGLNGIAQLDDMEPGNMLGRSWSGRPYDFHRYQNVFRSRVKQLMDELPVDVIQRYPSAVWLEQELFDNLQYQFALLQLLERREWDLIFLGANEIPLALLLFDMDASTLPPIVFLCHGMLAGDPVMDFWFRCDKTIARGKVEKSYYLRAGVDPAKIVDIGSASLDSFPSQDSLLSRRLNARVKLGLDLEQSVFIYALTYDIYRADVSQQVLSLIIESLEVCQAQGGLRDPVIYLKYHPAPSDDASFSFSRNQYPLNEFMRLKQSGFSVRILPTLQDNIGAADCFIAHESSTLFQSLEAGVPSISIRFDDGQSLPTMGFDLYQQQAAHSLCSIQQGAKHIGKELSRLCLMDRVDSIEHSRKGWNDIFECGRTEAISRLIEVTQDLLSGKA